MGGLFFWLFPSGHELHEKEPPMTRRELACAIADANAADEDLKVRLIGLSDGVVVLLRDLQDVALKVLVECQEESDQSAIGASQDRRIWCVICSEPAAFTAAACRMAEELHLYDVLDKPLAAAAGIGVVDRRNELEATLATLV